MGLATWQGCCAGQLLWLPGTYFEYPSEKPDNSYDTSSSKLERSDKLSIEHFLIDAKLLTTLVSSLRDLDSKDSGLWCFDWTGST